MGTTRATEARPWDAIRARAVGAWAATAGRGEARLDARVRLPIVLLAGFLVRLALAPFGGLSGDVETQQAWAQRLLAAPLADFYDPDFFVDHLPGDLWILWALAHVHDWFAPGEALPVVLLKLVPAVADVAIGALLFLIGRRVLSPGAGLVAAALFTFNPASIFLTATWGQWDAVSMAVALTAFWLLLRGNGEWAFPVLTYAALIKPPFAALAPFFLLVFLRQQGVPLPGWPGRNGRARAGAGGDAALRVLIAVLGSALVAAAVLLPFGIGVPPLDTRWTLFERLDFALDVYPHATLNAFTFWFPVVGNWRPEEQIFLLGLTVRTWGFLLFAAALAYVLVRFWRRAGVGALVWACLAVAVASFLLPTAMHERYLFPAIPFAALAAVLAPRRLAAVYGLLSLGLFLNLYWVYDLYEPALNLDLLADSAVFGNAVSLVNVGLLLYLLGFAPPLLAGAATSAVTGLPAAAAAPRPGADLLRWARPRADILIPTLLALGALGIFLPRLGEPGNYIYDEVYHAYTAGQYAAGNADAYIWSTSPPEVHRELFDRNVAYEWTHPPLGKLIIAGGIVLLGDDPIGWRIAGALFGAAGVVVAYHLGRRVTGRRSVGVLAAVLLPVSGMYFVQSRTATLDIFVLFFTLSSLLAFHAYLTAPPERARAPLLATGLLLGLAIGTKWNSAYAAGLIGLVVLWRLFRVGREAMATRARPEATGAFREQLLWLPVALGLAPAVAYLVTFVPFFLEGHGWGDFVHVHKEMWWYHNRINAADNPHDYYSSWWEWPLTLRPVWYHGGGDGELRTNTYTNGNPALFWLFVPAVLWAAWRWWRGGNRAALAVLLIGFFGQWLPWALSPRPAFAYHFFPAVPFGVLAVAVAVAALWRWGERGRLLAGAYVALAVVAFLYFYPIYSATPLPPRDFEARIWIESWR